MQAILAWKGDQWNELLQAAASHIYEQVEPDWRQSCLEALLVLRVVAMKDYRNRKVRLKRLIETAKPIGICNPHALTLVLRHFPRAKIKKQP